MAKTTRQLLGIWVIWDLIGFKKTPLRIMACCYHPTGSVLWWYRHMDAIFNTAVFLTSVQLLRSSNTFKYTFQPSTAVSLTSVQLLRSSNTFKYTFQPSTMTSPTLYPQSPDTIVKEPKWLSEPSSPDTILGEPEWLSIPKHQSSRQPLIHQTPNIDLAKKKESLTSQNRNRG